MNILVLGSGGREDALVTALAQSPRKDTIFVAPGNGGTAQKATNLTLDIDSKEAVVQCAKENGVELVVIGPEGPLVAGVADAVRAAGIWCFGPGEIGAQMEGSKVFAKKLMSKYGIPTASYGTFSDAQSAYDYLDKTGAPVVVKADGLAAGKGVFVAMTVEEARAGIEECFSGKFGDAGNTVVLEEYLVGPECSYLVFTDGKTVIPMATSQDHKRAYEGDLGPNTGGMGVYSPVPFVTAEEEEKMFSFTETAVAGLAREGIDFRGVLYVGFILTENGPRVLEFNARFGDPETQVILPRLNTDLVEVLLATAQGRLEEIELEWVDSWAVSVVLASGGYPGVFEKGFEIVGIDKAKQLEGVTVYHAGTKLNDDGTLVTAGGRVLNVTALAETFEEARALAYKAADLITFEGKFLRKDIGVQLLSKERSEVIATNVQED